MSQRKTKMMFLGDDITQEDIDEVMEMKTLIDEAITPTHPYISFEMLVLWWLSMEPAES